VGGAEEMSSAAHAALEAALRVSSPRGHHSPGANHVAHDSTPDKLLREQMVSTGARPRQRSQAGPGNTAHYAGRCTQSTPNSVQGAECRVQLQVVDGFGCDSL